MTDILKLIQHHFGSFSPGFKRIGRYINEHTQTAAILNSAQLANEAGVSEATLTRFVKNLGFSGFAEFKRELSQQVIDELSQTKTLAQSAAVFSGRGTIFREVVRNDIEHLGHLPRYISERLFNDVVDAIIGARHVFVLGLRSSYAIAFYLAFVLRPLLRNVTLVELGIGDLPEKLMHAGKPDVLFAVCLKRYTRDTVEVAKKFKQRGVRLIVLTNDPLSPIGQLGDLLLVVKTDILSYAAPMCLLTALINAIIHKDKEASIATLERHEAVLEELSTYIE